VNGHVSIAVILVKGTTRPFDIVKRTETNETCGCVRNRHVDVVDLEKTAENSALSEAEESRATVDSYL
jgi:hypothetical protein